MKPAAFVAQKTVHLAQHQDEAHERHRLSGRGRRAPPPQAAHRHQETALRHRVLRLSFQQPFKAKAAERRETERFVNRADSRHGWYQEANERLLLALSRPRTNFRF
jgi:hypothetical protein